MTFAWTGVQGASGYRLYTASGTGEFALATVSSGTTATAAASDTQTTRFYVTAFNATGESAPGQVGSFTPQIIPNPPPTTNAVPATPTNLRANLVTGHRLDIGWSSDPKAMTEVWRSMEGGSFRLMAVTPAGVTFFADTSFQKRKSYVYYVRSCNAVGCSRESNRLVYSTQ